MKLAMRESDGYYSLTFENTDDFKEIPVVRAVHLEYVNQLYASGNSSSVNDFLIGVSTWKAGPRTMHVPDYNLIANRIQQFGENTDDVVGEIARQSERPNYRNYDTIVRLKLGRNAILLAEQIHEKADKYLNSVDAVGEIFAAEFGKLLRADAPETD